MNKTESETCLCRGERVRKDHPRIALRGALDALLAGTIRTQVTLSDCGLSDAAQWLVPVTETVRALFAAEYTGEPFDLNATGAVDWDLLYDASHHPERYFGIGHPKVDAGMGKGVAELNLLRTSVRDCERLAVTAFYAKREDVVHALNRLSSYVYAAMCALIAGKGLPCR